MATREELYDQGDALKEEGKFEEAVERYQAALELDPDYALAHSALAVVHGKLGQHEKAVEHAQRVCELEPQDPFSYTALSVIYQRAFAGTGRREYIQMAEDAMARARMAQGG